MATRTAPRTPLTRRHVNVYLALATVGAIATNTWLLMTGAYG